MKKMILAGFAATLIVGCSDPVPPVEDPKNIVVGGQPMTQRAFVDKYCTDKTDHETCVKVRRAMVAGATRSETGVPRF